MRFLRGNFILTVSLCILAFFCMECKNNVHVQNNEATDFNVRNFSPLTNWQENKNEKTIQLDYSNAISAGFVIPTSQQAANGKFLMHFQIKNKSAEPEIYFYKIYYQNESYKFEERDSMTGKENELDEENYYGSWENTDVTFRSTNLIQPDNNFHDIIDSFRIVGNPRNELRYFTGNQNNRWQRNPRVGNYSFMLVVSTKENMEEKKIPDCIQNISLKNANKFESPYYFFLYGTGKELTNAVIQLSGTRLKVIAKPDLGKGIYIDSSSFYLEKNNQNYKSTCGIDSTLYRDAPFSQFVNHIDPAMRFENIPLVEDVLKNNYSKMDYNWNRCFYKREELISTTPQVAEHPCETVFADPVNRKIIIKNPGTEFGKWRKQSVRYYTTRFGIWQIQDQVQIN